MKKRIVILERHFTSREKGGWFASKEELRVLFDLTDIKLNEKLDSLNKPYRKNFYSVVGDFNLKTMKGKNEFVKYFLDNFKRFKGTWDFKDLKNIASEIIEEL